MTFPEKPGCDECQPFVDLFNKFYKYASAEFRNAQVILGIQDQWDAHGECNKRSLCLPYLKARAQALQDAREDNKPDIIGK